MTSQAPAPYATFGQRAVAFVIDLALVFVFLVVFALPMRMVSDGLGVSGLVLGVLLFAYFQYQNGSCGCSPGKALLGLRVVSTRTGEPIGGVLGVWRYVIAYLMSTLTCGFLSMIDYLLPLRDRRHQTLHDKAVGSIVLADQPRRPISDLFKP